MSKTIKLPPPPPEETVTATPADRPREAAIGAAVLAALGRPARLWRVAVLPLWGDYYRVNVLTGEDPTAVQIPNSYFVTADDRGAVLGSTPPIRKQY